MRATLMYGAGDVRVEDVPDPVLREPTDAVVRVLRSCICGSDLWPYWSMPPSEHGRRMGHEFLGVVEDTGPDVPGFGGVNVPGTASAGWYPRGASSTAAAWGLIQAADEDRTCLGVQRSTLGEDASYGASALDSRWISRLHTGPTRGAGCLLSPLVCRLANTPARWYAAWPHSRRSCSVGSV